MLLVLAHISVMEECEADFLKAFATYHEKIVAGEPGTITFDLYKDAAQDHAYTIIEMYRDQASYQDHLKSPWRDDSLRLIRSALSNSKASQHQRVDLSNA